MARKKAIWLNYDMGLRGDYNGLYAWLDNKKAVECGSSLAYFSHNTTKDTWEEVVTEIIEELQTQVNLTKSDRFYFILKDNKTEKVVGIFRNGSRKQAPWEGYGENDDNVQADSE